MKNSVSLERRNFTIGAALGLGAVVTGISGVSDLFASIDKFDKEKGAFSIAPNIWLEIRKDNTILITIPRSELGQGVRTSLSMITAEELDADWDKILPVNAEGDSKYGNQSTGGSTSIRVFWETMRTAGAQVRLMLVAAAAKHWGVPANKLRTENSYVYESQSYRKISYGELIEKVADIPIPDIKSIKLKLPEEFKIIGKTKWHIDNPDIVTGKAVYSSDFKLQGMKYAVVIRSPHIGGKLKSFDDLDARKINGFIGAFSIPEGVAVVANSTYNAFKCADKIKTEWIDGPIMNVGSDIISNELSSLLDEMPDLPANTVKSFEHIYEVPLLAHATMEPMNSFANFKDGKCEIFTMTQNPQTARSAAAKALGIGEENVKVNVLLSGGGFGRGHRNDFVAMAALISKLSGYPVKLTYSKEDDIKNDFYRPMSVHKVKTGIDKNGAVTGWIHKVASQGTVKATDPQYDLPGIKNLDVAKNYGIPTGSWRAVNNTQVYFVNESAIDELAILANVDPFDFRLNITKDTRLRRVLETVAEKSEWTRKLPKNSGRGIASFVGYGAYSAHVVEVTLSKAGELKVDRIVAVLDCGIAINPGNIEAQFMGAAMDALATALKSEITVKNGRIMQSGFHDFEWLTIKEAPKLEFFVIPSNESPGGIGEVGFPAVSPALCNAIYNACGVRVRKLPIKHTSLKVL